MDSSRNLYGTTSNGGAYGFGTVFELIASAGSYTEKVPHSFAGTPTDEVAPAASLLMETVFELVLSSGSYTEKLLHSLGGVGDGETPTAASVMDSAGIRRIRP